MEKQKNYKNQLLKISILFFWRNSKSNNHRNINIKYNIILNYYEIFILYIFQLFISIGNILKIENYFYLEI